MAHPRLLRGLLIVSVAVFTAGTPQAAQQAAKAIAISGVTVIDPASPAPLSGAVVLIEGSRVTRVAPAAQVRVPEGSTVIDGRGKYVIPGLADMHQHLQDGYRPEFDRAEQNLRRMLAFGFTTIFSTGHAQAFGVSFAQLKKAAAADDTPVPRFFGVGEFITVTGGHASQPSFGGGLLADTPDGGRRAVRQMKSIGVDAIKFVYDDMAGPGRTPLPMMSTEVMRAIIEESHAQNLKVYVHVTQLSPAKEVLRAGADGLVHAVISEPVDDEFVALLKQRNAVYVTTHALYNAVLDPAGWARRLEAIDDRHAIPAAVYERFKQMARPGAEAGRMAVVNRLRASLKKVHDAGVVVVAGTDTSVTGVLLGLSSQAELILLVEDGLTPMQALRAATVNAAKMLGREDLQGSVSAGKLADLVVLDADPLADIRNVRRVHRVVRGGVVYDPTELLREQ